MGQHAGPAEAAARRGATGLWGLAERVLTSDQRTALWLRYVEGHSADEIGRVLDRRAPAVRVLLHRTRFVLAEHLDPTLAEDPLGRGSAPRSCPRCPRVGP